MVCFNSYLFRVDINKFMISSIYFFLSCLLFGCFTISYRHRAAPGEGSASLSSREGCGRSQPGEEHGEQQGWRLPVLGWTSLMPPVPDEFSSPWPFPTGNVPQELPLCAPSPGHCWLPSCHLFFPATHLPSLLVPGIPGLPQPLPGYREWLRNTDPGKAGTYHNQRDYLG